MDLASFKARYPQFTDDVKTVIALDDASILIQNFNIKDEQKPLAIAYLAAHLLSMPDGATESFVTKVKAGDAEVSFSDKTANNDWLNQSSFGKLFLMLINQIESKQSYGVIGDDSSYAIRLDGRLDCDGEILRSPYDPCFIR